MYKRVLLKLSGEALMGDQKFGFDDICIDRICKDIASVYHAGFQIMIVIGGGNICRGGTISEMGIERVTGDNMGMLATVINALALQAKLENLSLITRVQSAIPITTITESFMRRKALRHLEKKRIIIFSAGTGNPFFTTDTAATLRAIELNCDVVVKGTKVDGAYSDDPKKNPDAIMYKTLSYQEVLSRRLNVMDSTAISLAQDNKLPVIIFNITKSGNLLKVLNNETDFTLIN